jgi:hypothetical protein
MNTIGWSGWHITIAMLKSIMKKESGLLRNTKHGEHGTHLNRVYTEPPKSMESKRGMHKKVKPSKNIFSRGR